MEYEYTEFPGRPSDERLDCVVRAMSLAAGVSYQHAHDVLEKVGRKYRKPTSDGQMNKAAKLLGLERRFPKGSKIKTSNFIKDFRSDQIIAVAVRGHLVAMRGDTELDLWNVTKPGKIVRWYYIKKS